MPPDIVKFPFSKKSAYASLTAMAVLVLICSACSHKPAVEDSCRIVPKGAKMYDLCIDQRFVSQPHDTVDGINKYKIINVHVWVRNNSDSSFKYVFRACESDLIFHIDNKNIDFIRDDCQGNFPIWILIGAHKMREAKLCLTVNIDSLAKNSRFKIGFDFIKYKNGQGFGKTKNKDIIWSNPVKVPLN